MKFITEEYIQENDIARRYLQKRLSPEEEAAFEVFLMEHPQVLEQVELDAAISHVLPEVVFQQKTKTKWFSSWLQPAVAFCLGLIIGLPIIYTLLSDNASTVGGAANIVYVERFRSGDQQQRTVKVDVTQNSGTLVIVIAPIYSGAASYTLTLVKNGITQKVSQ
jgi:hypothetical protein